MTFTVLGAGIPHLCFYIGLTYLFGTLFRSGLIGCVVGFASDMFFYRIYGLHWLSSGWWHTYIYLFSPLSITLNMYVGHVGTEKEELIFSMFGITTWRAAFCAAFLVGVGLLCAAVSYWRTRRRET